MAVVYPHTDNDITKIGIIKIINNIIFLEEGFQDQIIADENAIRNKKLIENEKNNQNFNYPKSIDKLFLEPTLAAAISYLPEMPLSSVLAESVEFKRVSETIPEDEEPIELNIQNVSRNF